MIKSSAFLTIYKVNVISPPFKSPLDCSKFSMAVGVEEEVKSLVNFLGLPAYKVTTHGDLKVGTHVDLECLMNPFLGY